MALSSILSIGLHIIAFLFLYYGLPFSKVKDRKESTIPLILNDEIKVSNKTNLKKNNQTVKPKKNIPTKKLIKNAPQLKPKKIISKKIDKNIERLVAKPVVKPKKQIEKKIVKNIKKKPSKKPIKKIRSTNRSISSKAILRNLAEANVVSKKRDKSSIVNQIKESLENQNVKKVIEEKKATASELDILRYHVAQCWNVPYSANQMKKIIKLKIFTNPDGSVVNVEILDIVSYQKDSVYRAAADSARRAVKDCSPLPLPKNKYDLFKVFTYNFDTSFING